ncbi:hypothetical protein BD414DRAFT_71918 [Trametes punicea]|nr:hypothetical protein BD414DRAFT_71918 [Trametes punicea]
MSSRSTAPMSSTHALTLFGPIFSPTSSCVIESSPPLFFRPPNFARKSFGLLLRHTPTQLHQPSLSDASVPLPGPRPLLFSASSSCRRLHLQSATSPLCTAARLACLSSAVSGLYRHRSSGTFPPSPSLPPGSHRSCPLIRCSSHPVS